jgi:hypothetical protein
MKTSEQTNEISTALSKAQGVMSHAKKDAPNPYFKSKYADWASCLETMRKPLADNGLALIQVPFNEGDRVGITTRLTHSSGQFFEGSFSAIPKDGSPQSLGSAITYCKRYGGSAIVGLATEDDDGAAASGTVVEKTLQKPAEKLFNAQKPAESEVVIDPLGEPVTLTKERPTKSTATPNPENDTANYVSELLQWGNEIGINQKFVEGVAVKAAMLTPEENIFQLTPNDAKTFNSDAGRKRLLQILKGEK